MVATKLNYNRNIFNNVLRLFIHTFLFLIVAFFTHSALAVFYDEPDEEGVLGFVFKGKQAVMGLGEGENHPN